MLTRVVRKASIPFEVIDGQGDPTTIQVECLSPEQTPRSLLGILCNDLLVLCRDPSDGRDPASHVELWAVLRMQTLPEPASIVHGNGRLFNSFVDLIATYQLRFLQFSESLIIKLSFISKLRRHPLP